MFGTTFFVHFFIFPLQEPYASVVARGLVEVKLEAVAEGHFM